MTCIARRAGLVLGAVCVALLLNPPVVAVSEVRDRVGAAIVSAILGENVKAAADKAAAVVADIMEKTEKK